MEGPIQVAVTHQPPVLTTEDDFSGTEGSYLLPHHKEEVEHLQRQHEFIKAAASGRLTTVDLPKGPRVLDTGCADGELTERRRRA